MQKEFFARQAMHLHAINTCRVNAAHNYFLDASATNHCQYF